MGKCLSRIIRCRCSAKTRKVAAVETSDLDVTLSNKLDKMLADAKLDVELFERLKTGIDKFSTSVEQINSTVDVSQATSKYNDQLTLAASHLESMNALYALQLEHGKAQSEMSKKYVEDKKNLQTNLRNLTKN